MVSSFQARLGVTVAQAPKGGTTSGEVEIPIVVRLE